MRILSLISSFFGAILIALVLFFVIYFFFPSNSQAFFGTSYRTSKDIKELKEGVTAIFEESAFKKDIDEFLEYFDNNRILHRAIGKGEDVIEELVKIGNEINFGGYSYSELKAILINGFAKLPKNTKQLKSLQRILSGVMEAF